MQPPSTKKPWSKPEKLLLGSVFGILALGAVVYFGSQHLHPWQEISVPTPTMPSPNAFDFYRLAGNQVKDAEKIDRVFPTKPTASPERLTLSQKAHLVRENAAALATLRHGFPYPYQPIPARSLNDTFPYYKRDRRLAYLLVLHNQVAAAHGNWAGAVDSDLDAVQMGEQIPHGSVLLGDLVGLACQAIGRRPIWAAVNHLRAAQAKTAARRLEKISASPVPLPDTLQEEKWFGQAAMQEQFHTSLAIFFLQGNALHNYTRYMDQSIAQARQPYVAGLPDPAQANDLVNAIFDPPIMPARVKDADNRAQNALLLVTLALRAYRLEHGAYPAQIDALTPTYLTHVPDDPFARAGPLRYRLGGGKYILYSVGPDGVDDGGRPIFDASKPAPKPGGRDQRSFVLKDSKGDIQAGVNL